MKNTVSLFILTLLFPFIINAQVPSSNSETLDINNIDATVYAAGINYWDLSSIATYRIDVGMLKPTIFSISPWIGGFDSNDSLHLAARLNNGIEFLSGPIVDILQFNDTITALEYNMIWKINRVQVDDFKQEWQLGNVTNGTYNIPNEILTWPGNHPSLSEQLAPYIDLNQDGNYNPMDGDYPNIKGDQMLWWVYNDNTSHESSGGKILGVEFRVSFYAYLFDNPPNDSIDAINYSSFLNFEIVNRSAETYDSTIIGLFADFDIGYAYDDFIGCHVDFNSFYGYNSSPIDGTGQLEAFGGPTPPPPSQSITLLKGPKANVVDGIDNDRDGTIDEADECWGMTNFMYYNSSMVTPTDPSLSYQYYNYMNSKYANGTHLTYDTTSVNTNYAFPGDSDPFGWGQNGQIMPPWYAGDSGIFPDDNSVIGSTGPVTFEPNEIISLDYVLNFTRADTGSNITSVEENFENISNIINWYENEIFPSSYAFGVTEIENKNEIKLFPNPANNIITISASYIFIEIEIFSNTGQLIKKINSNNKFEVIDISNFTSGYYFVKIKNTKEVWVKKIVVIR